MAKHQFSPTCQGSQVRHMFKPARLRLCSSTLEKEEVINGMKHILKQCTVFLVSDDEGLLLKGCNRRGRVLACQQILALPFVYCNTIT